MKPLRPVQAPGPLWADDINAAWVELTRQSKLIGDGVDVEQGPGTTLLRVPPAAVRLRARVWADVGDSGSGDGSGSGSGSGNDLDFCARVPMAWQQQRPTECGTWEDDPYGLSGSVDERNPAFEVNGGSVAEDSVVELTPGAVYLDSDQKVVQEWAFDAGSGSGPDFGFWAWLTDAPDGAAGADCLDLDPDAAVGYGWQEISFTSEGVPGHHFGHRSGTPCVRPAYEANGLAAPVFIEGRNLIVWMRSYVFTWPLDVCAPSAGGSGSGAGQGPSNSVTLPLAFLDPDTGQCCIKYVTITGPITVQFCTSEEIVCPDESGSGG
jgi:hypothetical protein